MGSKEKLVGITDRLDLGGDGSEGDNLGSEMILMTNGEGRIVAVTVAQSDVTSAETNTVRGFSPTQSSWLYWGE